MPTAPGLALAGAFPLFAPSAHPGWSAQLFEDQLAMLLEYAEASFECMEHRFRQLRGLACVKRVLQEYALANDVGLQFGDVPVGLVKMLLFPSAIHGFVPTTDTLRV